MFCAGHLPRLIRAAILAVVTGLALTACGIAAKPEVGSLTAQTKSAKAVDDPRSSHLACLQQDHIPVTEWGRIWMQIGSRPSGPTVEFTPTPGAAQEDQISGQVTGAEVIGSALLYPNQAPDPLLSKVEDCMALGVKG